MGAFIRCDNLKDVNVDSENKVYKNIDGVIYTDNRKTLILFPANHSLKSFAVLATVTKIGEGAFSGCAFKSVSIPASVTSIGRGAFDDCESLETITFKEVHEWYATKSIYDNGDRKDTGEKVKTATFSTIDFSEEKNFNDYYWHRVD